MKRTGVAVACLAALSFPAMAGPASGSEEITLRKAIALSLQNNNRLKIANERVEENRLRVREAWGKLLPELGTDAAITWYGADKGLMSLNDGQIDLKLIKATLVLNPGVFYNTLKASQDGHVIAMNDQKRIKLDTTVTAIRYYYQILLASELVKTREASVKALEEYQKVVNAAYKIGSCTRLDFLRVRVALANEKTRLINARNDAQTAMAALNIHMGREIDSPLDLDENAIMAVEGDEETIIRWTEAEKKQKIAGMTVDALKTRPEILMLKSKKDALVHGARVGESVYLWPTFFASGNYGLNKTLLKDEEARSTGDIHADYTLYTLSKILKPKGWNQNWSVTLGATYRWGGLLPVDPTHARADQLKSQAAQTDYEMDDFIRMVKLDIQRGFMKLVSSSNAIMSQKNNIEAAEESLRVAMLQLKNGMIDNTKLLEANVELCAAKTLYVQALYDLQSSRAELNRSMGYDHFSF